MLDKKYSFLNGNSKLIDKKDFFSMIQYQTIGTKQIAKEFFLTKKKRKISEVYEKV